VRPFYFWTTHSCSAPQQRSRTPAWHAPGAEAGARCFSAWQARRVRGRTLILLLQEGGSGCSEAVAAGRQFGLRHGLRRGSPRASRSSARPPRTAEAAAAGEQGPPEAAWSSAWPAPRWPDGLRRVLPHVSRSSSRCAKQIWGAWPQEASTELCGGYLQGPMNTYAKDGTLPWHTRQAGGAAREDPRSSFFCYPVQVRILLVASVSTSLRNSHASLFLALYRVGTARAVSTAAEFVRQPRTLPRAAC